MIKTGVDFALIVNPRINSDKVCDKARNVTFDQNVIAPDDMGRRDVDGVVL